MPARRTEEDPLIFGWRMPVREGRSLLFWLLMVVLGMAGFFYLFQVVYPQSQRFTPAPQQVLVLNPADPAARAVMSKMRDRDFMILPSDAEAAIGPELDDMVPLFHPSFEKHEMALQDLPHRVFTVPAARLLRMNEPVLPALDLKDMNPAPAATAAPASPPKLVLRLAGGAAGRELLHSPKLDNLLVIEPDAFRFQIGIDENGVVQFALPLETPPATSQDLVQHAIGHLKHLRFKPGSDNVSGLVWGTATFQWSTSK